MPTYDYKCDNCGRFEYVQKITDDPIKICPTCGGDVNRLISQNVGIIYKASGFYTTDYNRNGSSKTEAGSTTSSNSKDKAS